MTLVELLVAIVVLGILLAIAIPMFSDFMLVNRLTIGSNDFLTSLHLARSEAIKRQSRVVVCKSATGISCSVAGGWHQGWIVFQDVNNNAGLDAGEALIWQQQALPDGFPLTGNTPVASYVSYTPSGATRRTSGAFQMGTIELCHQSSSSSEARQIIVSSTGRPRIQKTTVAACP